jgi:protein gp37
MEKRFGGREDDFMPGQFHPGEVRVHPERLDIPLKRKKPTVWAIWNDLFHKDVPWRFVDDALAIMGCCESPDMRKHIFLVLTKRSQRMLNHARHRQENCMVWPPNVWAGVTVCNQSEADEKIPIMLQIPAAVRWVSIEPMLGPMDIKKYLCSHANCEDWGLCHGNHRNLCAQNGMISWVVLGGETGLGARPMHPDWVRSVRDQCQAAGVPFFFKGMLLDKKKKTLYLDGRTHLEVPNAIQGQGSSEGKKQRA